MKSERKYLTALGAWALAFGCSVGWGAFVMPGGTFLPIAGPVGSALGLCIGGAVMLILAVNYGYLMNRFPDSGGTYSYTKTAFGYDHGFLSAWFLILTYVAIIWANATALPLIARTVLGGTFQFGFDYEIAGFHVWFGEIMLAVGSLVLAALICLYRKRAERWQIVMAVVLLGGVVICFIAAMLKADGSRVFQPPFAPGAGEFGGTFTIFALAPWAYVGFESISHSAAEARFDLRRSFRIMAAAVICAAAAYSLLVLLAVTALPEGCADWTDYVGRLGSFDGLAAQPTFHAAGAAMGRAGVVLLSAAAFGGIVTGLIGNYVALSRLLCALSDDGMFPKWLGVKDRNLAPRRAILCILAVSAVLPFFGRTAISWIVDVTTVGATIAYAFASASAWKLAKETGDAKHEVFGLVGMIAAVLFALEFLIPNVVSIKTLSTESYLILAVWSIGGFLYFRFYIRRDREGRLGRSIVAWVVLLALIIFTSSVWMDQTAENALSQSNANIQAHLEENGGQIDEAFLASESAKTEHALRVSSSIQIALITLSLAILLEIYSFMQKRERQTEVEKLLAEQSSRAKTSFLSNMSHEIRTPMNAIIGLDNIALRDPELTPRTREHLEKIGASARHLLGLINDILDMSRIESGRMVLKNEEFSFREFLDQINIIINGQCQDKGLHYECQIVGRAADYYVGDDMKLKQVLINILGNSVKFTDPGGSVTLTVQDDGESDGRRTLRFRMQDTGAGMEKEFIPKIFDAFSQEDTTTTNRYGGSGLGMAITKNFVEMMGGSIQVESEKGVGSTFTVTVQLGASQRSFREAAPISLPTDLRILVVDDDEIACEHISLVLDALGLRADTETDPQKALAQLRQAHESGKPCGLLLTDYKMPEMNGLDLIRALRSFDGGETAAIILTGYNWDIIEDEALEGGADGILAKPLFPEVLQREVRAVLDRRGGTADPVTPVPIPETDETSLSAALAGKRVLMAEDVEQNAEILADLLELEDMLSEHARNGQEAVDMFAASPEGWYDVILMDVRMPVMDGLTAAASIRALDRPDAETVPIIAMTANVFDEDVMRSLEAGMNAHLGKPVEPERLYDTIAKHLS